MVYFVAVEVFPVAVKVQVPRLWLTLVVIMFRLTQFDCCNGEIWSRNSESIKGGQKNVFLAFSASSRLVTI